MESKLQQRALVRTLKGQCPSGALKEMSASLCNLVNSRREWREARTLLAYHPLSDEVDVSPLLDISLEAGKRVLLPVVEGDHLLLREYVGPQSLALGTYGIMEPVGDDFPESRYGEIDLALIPGMAFDGTNRRLGRGKGYYDRLLPRLACAYRMGVCFPFQLLPKVASEEHDMPMDDVVTIEM